MTRTELELSLAMMNWTNTHKIWAKMVWNHASNNFYIVSFIVCSWYMLPLFHLILASLLRCVGLTVINLKDKGEEENGEKDWRTQKEET